MAESPSKSAELLTWRHPKAFLRAHGFGAKKSFGQNFLNDPALLEAIALEVRRLLPGDLPRPWVIEFGAGLGALTEALLAQGMDVHAVERDRDLCPLLRQHFALALQNEDLHLYEANAVTFDVGGLPREGRGVLCGNLPYHLTSTLMLKTVELWERVYGAVYLIQDEVAARLVASPGSKTYGLLSVMVQSRFAARYVRRIGMGAFWPPPKVAGAVIALSPLKDIRAEVTTDALLRVVKAAFGQRRKTLRNAFKSFPDGEALLREAGLPLEARAETIAVQDYLNLAEVFMRRGE